ncbi:hypothetical protein Clacol_003245 [Clathrus columnatus]|uniref:Uncharacterized protein n=1 Tax=Clathrus columnatus TaxID=1419009 RepID=A0AAV5A8F9_9AGAM|nr:hypothetical protein Clacol_003245 [Clathrus columnatus]
MLKFGILIDPAVTEADGWWNDPSDLCHIMDRTRPYIERLWNDPTVKSELARKRLRLEESSGFYLDSLSRITDLRYVPSDDDVLKARLKTVGVIEHCFSLETGKQKGVDWKIYDVGGARSQVGSILIALSPKAEECYKRQAWVPYFQDTFDQVLAEAKLTGGVRLSHYMTSYGDRPNDYESVAKCKE